MHTYRLLIQVLLLLLGYHPTNAELAYECQMAKEGVSVMLSPTDFDWYFNNYFDNFVSC